MSTRNATKLEKMVNEFNDIVEQTFYLENKIKEWQKIVDKNKIEISKKMLRKNRVDIRVDEHTAFTVEKKVDTNIVFFEDQLAVKLDKKLYNKVVNKTLHIENLNGLIKFLKSYGVDPKEFKNYIKTTKTVDVHEVDRLVDCGEIGIEEIQGCYKVDFDEEIKVKKSK